MLKPGETATGTILCIAPWQLHDDGLAVDTSENGRKGGAGTLRP